MKSMRPVAPFH